jgi:hypothetical protein
LLWARRARVTALFDVFRPPSAGQVIVGLFTILTGKRCPDGRNHSDAESTNVYNRCAFGGA